MRQPFDFGQLVDGLTIEIRINEGHRQALRVQMIERFEARQGQRWPQPSLRMVVFIVMGFGLAGGLVVHQHMARDATQVTLHRVEAAAAAQDLETLTGYLSTNNVSIQLAVIGHLAILGDATTIAELEELLQRSDHPRIRSNTQQALRVIRQRLQSAPQGDVNEPVSLLPFPRWDDRREEPVSGSMPGQVLRFQILDPDGHPLRGVRIVVKASLNANTINERITNAKGAATLTDLPSGDIFCTLVKKGYDGVCDLQVRSVDGKIKLVLWPIG